MSKYRIEIVEVVSCVRNNFESFLRENSDYR